MIIQCAHTQVVPIKELKALFHPKNPNQHSDAQLDRLARILEYQGDRKAATISKRSGLLTAGHGRILAAEKAGWDAYPVDYQDYASDEMEYADLVADNAVSDWSTIDLAGINAALPEFGPDFDIDLLGIKDFVLEPAEKYEPGADDDEVPEHVEPKTKLGDVYQLGRHRLVCGDSTNICAVDLLMMGEKADMVFTDPPYGMKLDTDYSDMQKSALTPMGTVANSKKYREVAGDNEDFKPELIQTCLGVFSYCKEIFMFGADYYAELIADRNNGSWIVWDKRKTEELDKMYGSAFELCWSKAKHKRDLARITWAGVFGQVGIDAGVRLHPTQKPIRLVQWFFERWGSDGDRVVDLFGGSGSTLIACEKTNRKCFMMELDPHYCDVIVARFEKYTGKKAELLTEAN